MHFTQQECKHTRFSEKVTMDIVKLKELNATQMVMKVQVWCAECGLPFVLHAPHGFSTACPTQSNDGTVLVVPLDYPEAPVVPIPSIDLH